jgi:hypothetical protein
MDHTAICGCHMTTTEELLQASSSEDRSQRMQAHQHNEMHHPVIN